MGTENNKLDELRDRKPFRVPEGYFEGFTEDFMSRLPEKDNVVMQPERVSLYDRIKPLLYMAAAFAGLLIFINVFFQTNDASTGDKGGLFVNNASSTTSSDALTEADEDAEFLEYIEEMYADKYAISYIDDFLYN